MIIRPLEKTDLLELSNHIRKSLRENDVESLGFLPDINHIEKQTFLDPDYQMELLLGAFDEGKCIGSIMGLTRLWKEGREDTGYIKWILVDPDRRREGIGQSLYRAIENQFLEQNLKVYTFGSSSPSYFLPGMPKESAGGKEFFEKHGWITDSERVSILAELKEELLNHEELSLLPRSDRQYNCTIAKSEDKDELVEFVKNEFDGSWSNEVKMAMEGSNPNSGSIIVRDTEGSILGFAAFHGSNPQWFGPMGVREDLRKEGFGRLLFYSAIKEMMSRGITSTTLPWINGKEEFYPRFFHNFKWKKYYKFNKEI